LIVIYANLLTATFFLSAFFYWFLVLLFIFFFSLLGIFLSTCTASPNRSLVYSLLVWILFSIILPISWDYILSPKLYNDKLTELERIYVDKWDNTKRIMYVLVPDEANINLVGHFNWSGYFYDSKVWGVSETYDQHYRFQKYMIDNYYPSARETEQAMDMLSRKRISIENVRNRVFFYNPIVLFNSLSTKITGNSREDHLKFMQTGREIRDELTNLGISEGWLLDRRFFAVGDDNSQPGYMEDYFKNTGKTITNEEEWVEFYNYCSSFLENGEEYEMTLPVIREYSQPLYSFGEIFMRIYVYLVLFVGCILVVWVLTWWKFMEYDVR
jgi:ABC-type transport system involved in multi-copper enzyme maturation permease subunit